MTEQEEPRQKPRRDLLLVLLILPLGVLCMFMTGQAAIKLAPKWVIEADMRSLLDPNATFAALGVQPFIEPINPAILTLPAWGNLFLTPQAIIPTRVILTATPTPLRTIPPPPVIVTPADTPEPTATISGPIIIPTRNEPLQADLRIEKSDNSRTYTPGTSINYTILVTNLGPDGAPRLDIVDNLPSVITGITVNCTPSNLCGSNTSSGNRVSYTGAVLPYNAVLTISINGTVAANATGNLVNTASVALSANIRAFDPNPDNNTVTDRDTQLSVHDLAVIKSDGVGVTTYTANNPINYTVVVSNNGPSNARGITITDNIPLPVAAWTWECTTVVNAGNCDGVTNSTSNFRDTVNIQSGGRIEYRVTANPRGIPQDISNTVTVTLPTGPGFVDPDLSNNSATDIDIPYIDLQITKDDMGAAFTSGGMLTYTVTVTNNSTFNLSGITVSDPKPAQVTTWAWCIAPPCPAPIDADFSATINLNAKSSLVYNVTASISATAGLGNITNTATVNAPAGLVEASPVDNVSQAITSPYIDLQIMKTSPANTYTPPGPLVYTVIVTNNSPIDLNGVTVTDNIPTLITSWTWTCVPGVTGATCSSGSGSTNIIDTINLPASATVTYTITATINNFAAGPLVNSATVSPPAGIEDTDPENNTATDTDSNATGEPDIGPPDGNTIAPPTGTTRTYLFSPAISNDGTNAPDFVFYESYRSDLPGIALDLVILEISQDGSSWMPVFNWGDGNPDLNSKVHLAVNDVCGGSESDGCPVPASPTYLYSANGYYSGIEIDIDSLGLSGSYPWIRLTCPANPEDKDGTCDIDAIQPYYP